MTAGTSADVRVLSARDLTAVAKLLGRRPVEMSSSTIAAGSRSRTPDGWAVRSGAIFSDGELTSILHVGANVTPIETTPAAAAAFAQRLRDKPASSMAWSATNTW
ncbi:MAG: DUF4081 domain-containing protein [Marmoricola sp.]